MNHTEHNGTAMHAELNAVRKQARKLILVTEIVTSHRLDEMNHLRLREKLAAWRREMVLTRSRYRTKGSTGARGIYVG